MKSFRLFLKDCFANQKNQTVLFIAAVVTVFVICVTAFHYIRASSHEVFRFGGGETLIEGATNGCEPKDIIELGDELSKNTLISSMQTKEGQGLNVDLKDLPALKKAMEAFFMNTLLFKFASTMRSKPDEQKIRQVFSDMATKKETDCKMNNLLKHIDAGPYSADDKLEVKKYATRFEEIGKCLGICRPET